MVQSEIPIKVLVAKPGLDGHDRGAKVIARALRDAGMEVVYTGIRQTPQMIAEAAAQEDVDVIGLSILSGAHMEIFPEILRQLEDRGIQDVTLVAGGIIPEEDRQTLLGWGIKGVFGPGTATRDIVDFIQRTRGKKVKGKGRKRRKARSKASRYPHRSTSRPGPLRSQLQGLFILRHPEE